MSITNHIFNKSIFALLMTVLVFSSCQKEESFYSELPNADQYNNKIATTWNEVFLEVERFTSGYKPPVSARNYGYISLIAYESIVHANGKGYKSLSNYYDGLSLDKPVSDQVYNWEVALNSAYERAFELYFSTAPSEQQFKILEVAGNLRSGLQAETEFEVYQRSSKYGEYIAEEIYAWSGTDSWGHQAYLTNIDPQYIPPTDVSFWKPTYPDYTRALLPHWGKVRTFSDTDDLTIPPPPEFSTEANSQLYQEALFTRDLVDRIRAGEEAEELWIAQFWSDDCPILTFSPSGRWVSITNQIVRKESLDLTETVATYAKVGMALSDAGIKCWGGKYDYNLLRPIDYIREFMGDTEWNTVMCPDGSGGFYTPNFPTYPSGHATFGGAAAHVLTGIFGDSYRFTDRSHEGRTEFLGEPRTFNSLSEMAEENAYSRMPIGVHFASDSEAGINLGRSVGVRVNRLPWKS